LPVNVKMSAWLAGTGSINPATNASKQERSEMTGDDSFMFASPEQLTRGLISGCGR
jgi:hypothetical protein